MDIYAGGVPEDAFEGSDMDMSSSDSEAEEVGGHMPSYTWCLIFTPDPQFVIKTQSQPRADSHEGLNRQTDKDMPWHIHQASLWLHMGRRHTLEQRGLHVISLLCPS